MGGQGCLGGGGAQARKQSGQRAGKKGGARTGWARGKARGQTGKGGGGATLPATARAASAEALKLP